MAPTPSTLVKPTRPSDPSNGGTQPNPPVTLKLRKVGGNIAGFYSADGGKTQHFLGILAPGFDPKASLWLGLASTSLTDGRWTRWPTRTSCSPRWLQPDLRLHLHLRLRLRRQRVSKLA